MGTMLAEPVNLEFPVDNNIVSMFNHPASGDNVTDAMLRDVISHYREILFWIISGFDERESIPERDEIVEALKKSFDLVILRLS